MRRRLLPVLAVAAAAVLTTGVAVVTVQEDAPQADVLQAAAPDEPAEPVATLPSPTARPRTSPAPAAAPRSAAPAAAPQPRPARPAPAPAAPEPQPAQAADDGPGYGPNPGVVRHPYDPGRRTYSVTGSGVTLTATFATMTPKAGQPVEVALSARADQPACCSLVVQYGDGNDASRQIPAGSCATTASYSPSYAWNEPGRYQLQLQAGAAGCGQGERYASMRVWVEVGPGAPPVSNGPSRPTVKFDIERNPSPDDPGLLHFYGRGDDKDGYVAYFVLDPGDGTAPRRINGVWQGRCQSTSSGYAIGTTAYLPNDPPPSHRYAEPGTYTATLTAHSAGCDGKNEQTASATYTHSF